MMNKCIKFLIIIALFTNCEEVIEKDELNAVDNSEVWNDPTLATLYLNELYNRTIPGFGGNSNTNISDEAIGNPENIAGTGNMMYGLLQVSDTYGPYGVTAYADIRRINILIDEVDQGTMSQDDIDIIKGQALFLRAWSYWELVLMHGGVPMVMEPLDPNSGEAQFLPRDPASVCVDLIVKDLDDAIEMLPPSYPGSEYGRVTKAAAAAFKGRVLLFYASPQFNPDNLPERWTAAYEANKEAKQICQESGHDLYSDFSRIFLDEGNEEAILVNIFDGSLKSHGYENSVRPASVSNSGSTTGNPTWEFVKAFPMEDGKSIEGHPDYDSLVYWKDRDPRFYATVAYNSAEWAFPERMAVTDRQWTYFSNSVEPPNANSSTGFYVRKNVDTSLPKTETNRTPTDWIEIRYAEVLLNLAESANEAGHTDEAYTELIAIRERAGIEPGVGNMYGLETGMSKEEMREAVMLERQIELAFENKRHWDLRRRNMFVDDLGPSTPKLNGTRRTGIVTYLDTTYIKTLDPNIGNDSAFVHFEAHIRDTIDWDDPDNYNLFFNTNFNVALDEQDIRFLQPKYNFYYIQQGWLDRNPNLKQTVGWADTDTFDPLAD